MFSQRDRRITQWFSLIFLLFSHISVAQDEGWFNYKDRFLISDGRVADTANDNISHSEGQGFSMLLAVFNNDQQTFNKLWQWSNTHLYREDIGLYSWRYDPNSTPNVSDPNNASDGDTLIAWALLLAGEKWHNTRYTRASDKLQTALLKHTVINFAGFKVMLPGVSGFNQPNEITVNPSYFIFPAWKAFYRHSRVKAWKDLNESAKKMLSKMAFGKLQLPTDWVTLHSDGNMAPASKWPSRMSYNAIRIPLYLRWAYPNSPELTPFIQFWQRYPRDETPAWVDVISGDTAEYRMSSGILAIRDFTVGDSAAISSNVQQEEGYYSASLQLLAWWAAKEQN